MYIYIYVVQLIFLFINNCSLLVLFSDLQISNPKLPFGSLQLSLILAFDRIFGPFQRLPGLRRTNVDLSRPGAVEDTLPLMIGKSMEHQLASQLLAKAQRFQKRTTIAFWHAQLKPQKFVYFVGSHV